MGGKKVGFGWTMAGRSLGRQSFILSFSKNIQLINEK
jgi:hypothetical protein